MNQKKEAEIWMDKIAQEEADKAYKKEQEEWMKEDAKRIELLKDVYKGREKALLYQKKLKEDEKNAILEERKEVDKAIDDYYNKIEEINKIEADKRKAHQNQLLYQIREKEDLRKKGNDLYEEYLKITKNEKVFQNCNIYISKVNKQKQYNNSKSW